MNGYFPGSCTLFLNLLTLPGVSVGDLVWISIYYDQLYSHVDDSLTTTTLTLSVATNAVTTIMIAYKLWYVCCGRVHWMRRLNVNRSCRSYRTSVGKAARLSGRKSPVQNILILLVESGLVYLGFQVSHFYIPLADMSVQDVPSSHPSDR